MATLTEKLQLTLNSKNAIKAALIAKGAEIDDTTEFKDYATAIENMSGGGAKEITVPAGSTTDTIDLGEPLVVQRTYEGENVGTLVIQFLDNTNYSYADYSLTAVSSTLADFSDSTGFTKNNNYSTMSIIGNSRRFIQFSNGTHAPIKFKYVYL